MWIRGKIIDLNELAPGFSDLLYAANDINDRGHIAAQSFTPGTERYSAVWAIPTRRHRDGEATARGNSNFPVGVSSTYSSTVLRMAAYPEASVEQH